LTEQLTDIFQFLLTWSFCRLQIIKSNNDYISNFIREFGFHTLPLTESIGHRAAVYVEEYSLSHGIRAIDAIIAATATENHLPLCSGNAKHFKAIQELKFKLFKP
jgi:predicted nucleic acid-binding protein